MQTSYSLAMDDGIAGDIFDTQPKNVISGVAVEEIPFGRALALQSGSTLGAAKWQLPSAVTNPIGAVSVRDLGLIAGKYSAKDTVAAMTEGVIWVETETAVAAGDSVYVRVDGKKQVQTFVLDADLVTGNTITAKFNGEEVSQDFDTNHLTTMNAFAAKIQALSDVSTAVVGGVGNRTITITSEMDATVAITDEEITGGASQANITITETIAGILTSARGKFRNADDGATAVLVTGLKWYKAHASGRAPLLVTLDISVS